MEELIKILGRKPNKMEETIYRLQKDNPNYRFEKDSNGNLISIRI